VSGTSVTHVSGRSTPGPGVPVVFGMNFQAVSVGQKLAKDNSDGKAARNSEAYLRREHGGRQRSPFFLASHSHPAIIPLQSFSRSAVKIR
jgi:hypothetical protein